MLAALHWHLMWKLDSTPQFLHGVQWPFWDGAEVTSKNSLAQVTGFTAGKSNNLEQEPPIPDAYFIPPSEQDQAYEQLQGKDLGCSENYDLPQGKTGSMTDAQWTLESTRANQLDIRSDESLQTMGINSNTNCDDVHLNGATSGGTIKDQCNMSKWATAQQSNLNCTTPSADPSIEPPSTWARTWIIRPPERFQHDMAFIMQPWDSILEVQDYKIQEQLQDPVAFAATPNPDTMYYHEAPRAPDRKQFLEVMKKEVNNHKTRKHWQLVPCSEVPDGMIILPAIWSMKHKKWHTQTNKIYKW